MYVRKTIDVWYVMTNYGYGWECETIECSKQAAKAQARCYRENTKALVRIEKHREKINK